MARKSVIVWTVLILLSGSLASVPAAAQEEEFTQVGAQALRFEHYARHLAIDASEWGTPTKGGNVSLFSGVGGPFDRDDNDEASQIPDSGLPDADVIASWNPRNDTLYWSLVDGVCDSFWTEVYEMDDQRPEEYTYPDGNDLFVRHKMGAPVPFRGVFLEARDIEMENQITLVSGWDPMRDDGDGIYLYYYSWDATPGNGNGGHETGCQEGTDYGDWRSGGQVVTGDVAWMELNEDYGLVSVTGDKTGSTVLVHMGNYQGWRGTTAPSAGMRNHGYRDNVAQNSLVGPVEAGGGMFPQPSQRSGGLWTMSAPAFGGAACSDDPPGISAEYADLAEEYAGPLGTVTARWGSVKDADGNDVEVLMVQDTTYKESATDPLTGKIDIYWYKTETNRLSGGSIVVAQQWALLDTIRPTAPQYFFKSSHRTGLGYDTFENGLAVLEHYIDEGVTRADVALYSFNSECDADADDRWMDDPERPGYFELIRDGQHLHTEEFTPHHIIDATDDGSAQLALWSPKYNALVFDKDPYMHETVQRDGALSFYTFLPELGYPKVHRDSTDVEDTDKPLHFIPCPIVRKEVPQGHMFWSQILDFEPGSRRVMAYAEMDYEWDNNNTFLPHRFTTDEPSFYWFDESGPEGCEPPELVVPCFYDVSYDEELDQETMTADDEDCRPQPECEARLDDEDCRPRRRAGGGTSRPDDGDPAVDPADPSSGGGSPPADEYTFDRDTDGDGIPDVDDVCPYDATKPGRDADGKIIEGSVECSDSREINDGEKRKSKDVSGFAKVGVESNSPGMALWLALLIGAALVTLLIIVARRRNDDEEDQ